MNYKNIDFYDLINRYLAGEVTKEDDERLQAWLDDSPENRALYIQLEEIWQNASPVVPEQFPEAELAWAEMEAKLKPDQEKARVQSLKRPLAAHTGFSYWPRYALSIAAALALVAGVKLWLSQPGDTGLLEITTQNAQRTEHRLPDGTSVHLNSASKIKYDALSFDSTRIVLLDGEAFFEVVHRGRPFVVKTETAEIKVLGTKFNIWARNEETRVVVSHGRVALSSVNSSPESGVVLAGKQMSICHKNEIPRNPTNVDAAEFLGWLEGRIVFRQTPLAEIIAELHRHYDVPIKLADTASGPKTVTGSFKKQPLETVLQSICLTLDLQYSMVDGQYLIEQK